MKSQFEIADELLNIEGVDDVQVSERKLRIVHAPSESDVERLPERIASEVEDVIEGTSWSPEYDTLRDAEIHRWRHGRSNPILPASEHEAGFEQQVPLSQPKSF